MKLNLYVVMDTVLQSSGPVQESKNDAAAIRTFADLMKKQDESVVADFKLYKVGTFDHETNIGFFHTPVLVERKVLKQTADGIQEE